MPVTPEQQADIDALRSDQNQTLRAVSMGMENHLYKAYPVLDHGFVRVVDYMGDDAAICQAARVSYCLLYTSPSPRDRTRSRMPSSA